MTTPTFTVNAPASAREATNPLGLVRLDHIQVCGTVADLEPLYLRMGFARVGCSRSQGGALHHLRQNRMDILLGETDGSHPCGRYAAAHGAGVNALAFEVEDVPGALQEAVRRGAQVRMEPRRTEFDGGALTQAAIQGFGDVWNLFLTREGNAPFLPGLEPDPRPAACRPGLLRVDHLTNNVGVGEMDRWVAFYEQVYGFAVVREFHIRGALGTGLTSKVVQSSNGRIIIPINEPTDRKSQVQEFVDRHRGPGVQHVAMSASDILQTLPILRGEGFRFLTNPTTYYDLLPGRIQAGGYRVAEDLAGIQELGILIDGDASGYLLQIFTEDQIGPLFFEIIQRKGNRGFGEGNFKALYDSIELDQRQRGVI